MTDPLAYIRGSCTDSSWNSTDCGNTCKNVFPGSFAPITACPGAEFCCTVNADNLQSCCGLNGNTAASLFTLGAASTATVIGVTSSTANFVSNPTTSVQSISTSTISIANTGGNSGVSGNGSKGTKIGIAVGVVAGVLLIVAFIFLLMRFRRRKQTNAVYYLEGGAQQNPQWETGTQELPDDFKEDLGATKETDTMLKERNSVINCAELDGNSVPRELHG
ncbi:hypothetical protein BP6252_13811 [Coleophoma cylindrospora]|uniref:Mid2 domain-containing protein n=1 Tax=Coleophoma cylindrospora TaxID=1849047 RepID=A0A3D8Q5S5_9HELO|nr:hypothetical protein BP6252_13811 [Coleophoma cylindrospora]